MIVPFRFVLLRTENLQLAEVTDGHAVGGAIDG